MYFDFEDYRPDTPHAEPAISVREGVLLSVIFHALVILYALFGPPLPSGRHVSQRLALTEPPSDSPRFVFVRPRVDLEAAKPSPRAEGSDKDRLARSPERAPDPKNEFPFSRGNSPERVEADPSPPVAQIDRPGEGDNDPGSVLPMPKAPMSAVVMPAGRGAASGPLGEALRNLQRYVDSSAFDNPQGNGGDFGSSIQFDTMGVEFGPWIRRFIAQVKRNWFMPLAAWTMKGHVVITFNVHKNGSISDIQVQAPSSIDSFNHAAANALTASNPTQPLPPEYPSDHAFFTVTFYYNETPPSP